MQAQLKRIDLEFITPGKTSRGTLYTKPSWFIILQEDGRTGIGECSTIPGLNPEYNAQYEDRIGQLVKEINVDGMPQLSLWDEYPSIRFGLETALLDLQTPPQGILFPSDFTEGTSGIPINGLIWMGNIEEMRQRVAEKLEQGFKVLKLKVGALDWQEELNLLKTLRQEFNPHELEIRLDANGAFAPDEALDLLSRYADHHIHSIEQPIKAGQWDDMARLCEKSPIPIALDEELISISRVEEKQKLLQHINPQYIILKPSLVGGLAKSDEWIALAQGRKIGWWSTSALESNVGLNAIAQWVFTHKPAMVQGLGTGQVFFNNIKAPLILKGMRLWYDAEMEWKFTI